MAGSSGSAGGDGNPDGSYQDRWIACQEQGISIRGYYFPWGTKHVPYGSIREARRLSMASLRGKGRIWGTANPRYWASFDPGRPTKQEAFTLQLGRSVQPFVTPDDPDAFAAALQAHGVAVRTGDQDGDAPLI